MNNKCRLCHSTCMQEVINFGALPIGRHLLTKLGSRQRTFPIVLDRCASCSFLQLRSPIRPELIYTSNAVPSAWKNQPHLGRIIDLLNDYAYLGAKILEIGSNDCTFLKKLHKERFSYLVGVDININEDVHCEQLKAEFNIAAADYLNSRHGKFDVVICRHTLEHIEDLQNFGDALCRVCDRNTHVFIEVPNFDFNLTLSDYSGIWEEHCNYFTLVTLSRYLSRFGFEVVFNEKFNYSGQSMLVIAKYTGCSEYLDTDYPDKVSAFQNNWPQYKKRLAIKLSQLDKPIAIYGCGARSTSLINLTGIYKQISYLIDDQEEKQYKYQPGSRLLIQSSQVLEHCNTCLLAVNAENEESVIERNSNFKGKWYSLLPLSKRTLGI